MANLESYTGSIEIISGLKPKNNGDFPLVEAHDIQVREDGTRLDEVLDELKNDSGGSLTVVDDGDGNVTLMSTNSNTGVVDDGDGNVIISKL